MCEIKSLSRRYSDKTMRTINEVLVLINIHRAVDSWRSESYDVIYYSCIGKVLADLAASKEARSKAEGKVKR